MTKYVSEKRVQEFWTDYPMIFFGKDAESSRPEDIYAFMEQSMRDKGRHFQDPGAPLLSRYLDYPSFKGKPMLEIGYGTGWLLNEFVEAGAKVHGIDLSKSHYELCRHRFRIADVDIRIASAENIPFGDESFDLVVAWGVLHHASDDQRCYDEVYRVLKPGGRCLMMLYRKGGIQYVLHKLIKKGVLRGGLIKHGFDVEKFINSVTDVHFDGSPGAPISRHYSRDGLIRRFRRFSKIELEITGSWGELSHIPAGRLPISDWMLSDAARERLLKRFGGFWIVNLAR